MPESYTL